MLLSLQQMKRISVGPLVPGQRRVKRAGLSVARVWKDFYGQAPIVDGEYLRFTVSTGAVDRALDTVSVDGWDLTAYRASPVILWAHDHDRPAIARCVDIGPDNGALKATVAFDQADPFAAEIMRKCREGFLNTTSVGFRPLEYDVTNDPARGADEWFPGFDFTRQELTEISIVNVPCNAECLIDAPADESDPIAGLLATVTNAVPARLDPRLRAFHRLAV